MRIKGHNEITMKGLTDKSKIAQQCWFVVKKRLKIHIKPHFYVKKIIEVHNIKLSDHPITIDTSICELGPLWMPLFKMN